MSKISDLLPEIGNTVAYCPQLALALGGCIEGIFMSQLLFWHDKVPDGRIWKTREQFFAETGLGRWEQKTARIHLVSLAVITEEHDWAQNKLYFTVNLDALKAVWKRYRETGVSPTFEAKPKKRPLGEVAMQPLLGPPRRSGHATFPRARSERVQKKKEKRKRGTPDKPALILLFFQSPNPNPRPPIVPRRPPFKATGALPRRAKRRG